MSKVPSHTLEVGREEIIAQSPSEYLALVDLESYPAFIGKDSDHLDLMAHLQNQRAALTAVAWGAPKKPLRLRFLVTEDDHTVDRHIRVAGHQPTATGTLRTYNGQLCLTSDERIADCARNKKSRLLRQGNTLSEFPPARLLHVPPGLHYLHILYHFPFPDPNGARESWSEPKADYTVLLRHHPFPPPRPAPIRLHNGFLNYSGDEAANRPLSGVITSHARVW